MNSTQFISSPSNSIDIKQEVDNLIEQYELKKKLVGKSKKHKKERVFEIDKIGKGQFNVSESYLIYRNNLDSLHEEDKRPTQNSSKAFVEKISTNKENYAKAVQNATNALTVLSNQSLTKIVASNLFVDQYFQRAVAYEKQGQLNRAIEDYSTCIHLDKSFALAYFNRSGICRAKGKYKQALEDINAAITCDGGKNQEFLRNRSLLHRESGSYFEATRDILRYKEINFLQSFKDSNMDHNKDSSNRRRSERPLPSIQKSVSSASSSSYDVKSSWPNYDDPIVTALKIPCEIRSEVDSVPIVEFIKNLNIFLSFGSSMNVINQIAKKLNLETYSMGRKIFEEGQPGFHFYIILEGDVAIVKNRMMVKESGNVKTEQMVLIKLSTGAYFGENALENSNGLRTAGAVAVREVKLMVLHANDYQTILSHYRIMVKNEVLQSLRSPTSLLRHWSVEVLEKLAQLATIRKYRAGDEIIKSGDFVNSLMVIKSGIAMVLKTIPRPDVSDMIDGNNSTFEKLSRMSLTPQLPSPQDRRGKGSSQQQLPHRMDRKMIWSHDDADPQLMEKSSSDPELKLPLIRSELDLDPVSSNPSPVHPMDSKEGTIELIVANLMSGNIIGELSILSQYQLSTVTVMAFTATEVYNFQNDFLFQAGILEDESVLSILRANSEEYNPPVEKITDKYRKKFRWEMKKLRDIQRSSKRG